MKPLVYIAAAFRVPDPVSNCRIAAATGQQLRDALGIVPLIPHLSMLEDMMCPRDVQYWLDATMDQMRLCDAVYRIAGFSEGADAEEAEAKRLGIPCFYCIHDLRVWAKEWKKQHDPDAR